jgi:hypothetical protein
VERVSLTASESSTGFERAESFFHAGGQFALRELPAGTYNVTAETPDGMVSVPVTLADGEQKKGVALIVTPPVEGENGSPAAGASDR